MKGLRFKNNNFSGIVRLVLVLTLVVVLIFFTSSGFVKKIRSYTLQYFKVPASLLGAWQRLFVRFTGFTGVVDTLKDKTGRVEVSREFEVGVLRKENEVLRKALALKETFQFPLRSAGVLYYSRELGREFITVDVGSDDGLKEGDLVLDEHLIFVGTVKDLAGNLAKVDIASNPANTFEARLTSLGGVPLLTKGLGQRTFALELIPFDIPLRKGDFVALVYGGKDLLLGEVVSERSIKSAVFKEGRATLLVRPELLRFVFVLPHR